MFLHNNQVNYKTNRYSIQLETDNYALYKLCLKVCRICIDMNKKNLFISKRNKKINTMVYISCELKIFNKYNKECQKVKQKLKNVILIITMGITATFSIVTLSTIHIESDIDSNYFSYHEIPQYINQPYTIINNNEPFFDVNDFSVEPFEYYSDLDSLGRCGVAYACLDDELMPTDNRGSISQIKPSGWHSAKYNIISGKYLYNRCHLIGFQLAGENANEKNLITGTRYLNIEGMLPFENIVADYIEETDGSVWYRVTPIYNKEDLVAYGVLMEAMSVEDSGEDIEFNIFAYNVQPGIQIDYSTGESILAN